MTQHNYTLKDLSALTFQQMRLLGYSESTMHIYQRHYQEIVSFSPSLGEETVFSEQFMQSYLAEYCHSHSLDTPNGIKRYRETQRLLNMMLDCAVHGVILRHKTRQKTPPESFTAVFHTFENFAKERGMSDASYRRIVYVIEQFAFCLFQKGKKDFSVITNEDILSFAKTQLGYSKKTTAVSMYALRVFVFFLRTTGLNPTVTKECIPTIKYVNRRHLPKIWSSEECRRILDAVERNNPTGKRDYAILMLAVNLGMRTSDILALEFCNIDWNRKLITFQQKKTGVTNTLQLDRETGWAIIDYLKNGRPSVSQYSTIFLTHQAPFRPMNAFNSSLQKYLERANIHYEKEQMHSMHSLRHSLATRMLNQEIPVSTISDILGHISIHSSVDYLAIDIESMKTCALEVES